MFPPLPSRDPRAAAGTPPEGHSPPGSRLRQGRISPLCHVSAEAQPGELIVGRVDLLQRGAEPVGRFGFFSGPGEIALLVDILDDGEEVVAIELRVRPVRQEVTRSERLTD